MGKEDPGTERISTLTEGQRQVLNKLSSFLSGQVGRGLNFQGELTAPTNSLLEGAFEAAERLQAGGRFGDERASATARLLSGQPAFTLDPARREAQFAQAVEAPTLRAFQREILPQISELAAGRNLTRSSGFMDALLRAGTDLSTELASGRAQLMRQDDVDLRRAQESAFGRLASGITAGRAEDALPIDVGLTVGGAQRGIAQEGLTNEFNRFMLNQPALNPALSLINPVLGSQAFALRQTPGKPGFGGAIGGLLGAGAGSYFGPVGANLGFSLGSSIGGLV